MIGHIVGVLALAGGLSAAALQQARAQDGDAALALELNRLEPSEKGCRVTFVAQNRLGGAIGKLAFEIVLFDRMGLVSRLLVLDFKDLPAAKTKVRQFDIAGIDCSEIGRVLVNSTAECAGENLDPAICMSALHPATRTNVEFGS